MMLARSFKEGNTMRLAEIQKLSREELENRFMSLVVAKAKITLALAEVDDEFKQLDKDVNNERVN